MKKLLYLWAVFTCILCSGLHSPDPDWGFFAHKVINRMAVFILPPDLIQFYKKHIDHLSEHAPDPDKRRYSVEGEAIRHYMDIDHWGEAPFPQLPRKLEDALAKYLELHLITETNDTILIKGPGIDTINSEVILSSGVNISYKHYKNFIKAKILRNFPAKNWTFPSDTINKFFGKDLTKGQRGTFFIKEDFSQHGINPYHIKIQYERLVYAYKSMNKKSILRLSGDLGHYIADAHVPLHATSNYNGQLSDQVGIHAFWESRLPELFANQEYHYFVGKARYISDVQAFAWQTIIESSRLSKLVLLKEKNLSAQISEDKQYAFELRLGRTVRVQSRNYSEAYHQSLDGMVQNRMQDAVLALGSLWFSAWVDAGQPVLDSLPLIRWTHEDIQKMEGLDINYSSGDPLGRNCK